MATEEAAPPAASRVHGAHAYAGRPQGAERTAPQGPPPSRSLRATLRDSSPHDGAGHQPRAASSPPARLSSTARARCFACAPSLGHAHDAERTLPPALRLHRQQARRPALGYPQPRTPQAAGSRPSTALPGRLGRSTHRTAEHGRRPVPHVAGGHRIACAQVASARTGGALQGRRGNES